MSKQKLNSFSALVYSTNPEVKTELNPIEESTLPITQQKLRIRLETKHRGGKAATLIAGFIGTNDDFEQLAKQLKSHCGTGGTAKDGEILIQGDNKEKVKTYLLKLGYKDTK
jgi:translation initiation factor 1